jgi:hypothetical protein
MFIVVQIIIQILGNWCAIVLLQFTEASFQNKN